MYDYDERIPAYKPLPSKSKFAKPNGNGQVPKDCVNFNFGKKHCWIDGDYGETATNCVVLNGQYCNKYRRSN